MAACRLRPLLQLRLTRFDNEITVKGLMLSVGQAAVFAAGHHVAKVGEVEALINFVPGVSPELTPPPSLSVIRRGSYHNSPD
jgi:hypothetical protein